MPHQIFSGISEFGHIEYLLLCNGLQGSSILVTSLTDAAAFVAGTLTQLPALRDFAIYAFLGITFDFLYQVTFFAALVVLDARREHRARMGAPYCGLQFGCGKTEFDDFLSLPVGAPQMKHWLSCSYSCSMQSCIHAHNIS